MSIIETLYPDKLNPGDTIGIAAPAGSFNRERFARGVKVLEEMGFAVYVPEAIMEEHFWFAGNDDSRAEVFHELFLNPDVKAILCARGGYGSMRILDLIVWDVIIDNPKIFAGFSDISALLSVVNQRTGIVTYHSPVVTSLADADEQTIRAVKQMLLSRKEVILPAEPGVTICPGRTAGRLMGGNLTTLNHMIGTGYFPDLAGVVLMLEDVSEKPYKIDRMLTQMALSGLFDDLSGVVLGTYEDCGDTDEIYNIFSEMFSKKNIPVAGGFKFGHSITNLPFPVGGQAVFDAENLSVVYSI